jgi:hypothetical protein
MPEGKISEQNVGRLVNSIPIDKYERMVLDGMREYQAVVDVGGGSALVVRVQMNGSNDDQGDLSVYSPGKQIFFHETYSPNCSNGSVKEICSRVAVEADALANKIKRQKETALFSKVEAYINGLP